MIKNIFLIIGLTLFLTACQESPIFNGDIKVTLHDSKPSISSVKVQNDQLVVTGTNLSKVSNAKIEGGTNHVFSIESKTDSQLVLNAKSALSFLVGQSLNLIVSSANASATFPISFELQNGQVTAAKLHHMGASAGQFLRFNGTTWTPSSVTTNQVYVGTYDAATDTPNLSSAAAAAGTYYIVTVAGTQDLGSGPTNYAVGDWVISDGTNWSKVSVGTNTVSAFNGRTGAVVPLAGDYSWSMLTKATGKITGSKISEIADVDVTGIQDGDILQWNAGVSKWEVNAVPAPTISAGSITNTQLANSAVDSNKIVDGTIVNADISAGAAISQSKIQNLTTDLGNKEPLLPTGGTTAQYLRGNKTLATLDTSVVPESGNLYFTPARVLSTLITTYSAGGTGAIAVTDTVPQALSKLETKTNTLGNYVLRDGSSAMTGALQMGGNKITGLGTPTVNTDAATKAYVDSVAGGVSSSQWTTSGSDISYSTGKVGIGISSPSTTLHVYSNQPQATAQPNRAGLIIEGEADSFGGRIATRVYSDTEGPIFIGYRAMGSKAAPTAVTAGKALVNMIGYGYDGSGWSSNSSSPIISMATTQTWTNTAKGSAIGFQTTPNNTTANVLRMLINQDGNVAIGNNQSPAERLDVDGNILVNGKVRLKSTTANFVELKAPAGLSTTLTFNFPDSYGSNNQVLTTDGAGNLSWTTPASGGGGAPTGSAGGDLTGTYPNPTIAAGLDATKIGGGAISNTEFSYLDGVTSSIQTQLTTLQTGKEPTITAGTTAQYLRGNKTLGNFDTDVMAALLPMGFTASGAGDVGPLDSMQTALAKLQGQIDGHDTQIATATTWSKNSGKIFYNTGNVGIGTNNPGSLLEISTGATAPSSDVDLITLSVTSNVVDPTGTGAVFDNGLKKYKIGVSDDEIPLLDGTGSSASGIGTAMSFSMTPFTDTTGSGPQDFTSYIFKGATTAQDLLIQNGHIISRALTVKQKVAIGTNNVPAYSLDMLGKTDGIRLPAGATSARPSVTSTSGIVRFNTDSKATEFYDGNQWISLGNLRPVPASTSLLMKACPTGWTEIGSVPAGGPTAGNCNGTACRICTSPATPSTIPASSIALFDQCPKDWTFLSRLNGSAPAVGFASALFAACQSPAWDTGLPVQVKTVAVSCPAEWSDLGITGPTGPASASCGGANCRVCEVGNHTSSYLITAPKATSATAEGERVVIKGGSPGETSGKGGSAYLLGSWGIDGDGGDINIQAGLGVSTTSTDRNGGAVYITSGTGAANGNAGNIQLTPGIETGSGSAGSVILQSKKTGIGFSFGTSTPPQYVLDIDGDTNIAMASSLRFGGTAVCAAGGCTSSSDRRLKKNIHPLQDSLLKITQLQGVEYDYIDHMKFGKQHQVGVIAQDVEKVFPEVVKTDSKTGFKSVAYDHLVAPIIEAIKELFGMTKENTREIASLKEKNKKLEEENAAIKAYLCQKDPAAPICK